MIAYVTLGAIDLEASRRFYDAVLAVKGWTQHAQYGEYICYTPGGAEPTSESLWICKPFNGEPASSGNGAMIALDGATRDEVDAFHAAAMANGGTDEGAPGHREHYGPNWYAAYLRDPTGNKLAIVCNRPVTES